MFKKYKKKYKFVVFFISILFCSNDKPGLISYEITNGKILSQTHFPRSDIYEFHMSNGATVFFKKINSSSNEILFKSFSLGGKSVLSKNELVNAAIIPDLINQSFYEKYNYLDLNTELSDNLIHYTNYIDQYYHGSVGQSSKENFKIFCELLHLNWSKPVYDPDIFKKVIKKLKNQIIKEKSNPYKQYEVLIDRVNYSNHYSKQSINTNALYQLNLDDVLYTYRDLFSNPQNFSFIFVGDIDIDEFKNHISKYIGGLPMISKQLAKINKGCYYFPFIPANKSIKYELEDTTKNTITFYKAIDNKIDSYINLDIAVKVFAKKMKNELGNDFNIEFGFHTMQPIKSYTITYISYYDDGSYNIKKMFNLIKRLKKDLKIKKELNQIINSEIEKRNDLVLNNRYWLEKINKYIIYNVNFYKITEEEERLSKINPGEIKKLIVKHFSKLRHSVVSLN
ncbi:MAG: hypothetical protein CMG07_01165 [Candidatus Marinimicrobia bacterium]|nr:hypothetical protein [Candidatus Neomarinimicrobiota bacterium]